MNPQFCLGGNTQKLSSFPGYISPTINTQQLHRSRHQPPTPPSCRYRITAQAGQRVKVTQLTFKSSPDFLLASPSSCKKALAIVRDLPDTRDAATAVTSAAKNVCAGAPGEKPVMTSAGSEMLVDVMMTSHDEADQADQYLLLYEGEN